MSDRLTALRLFARAARTGNFSTAGRDLGLSQPSASRLIAALESDLGASLFVRTTRAVSLTEAGSTYLLRIEELLASLDEADHELRGSGELRGVLRIGTPISFGLREIIPRLGAFMARHPELKIEVRVTDRYPDLVTEGIDVSFQFGALPDSSAAVRRILQQPKILAASPDYLREHGTPTAPLDLEHHSVIVSPAHSTSMMTFRKDGTTLSVRPGSRLTFTVNEAAMASAVAGLGIAASSAISARKELETGELVRILADWDFGSIEVSAVFASGRTVKPAARAFTDYLIADFRR